MKKDIFKKIYRYDSTDNVYLVEMAINNFYEIFHDWDGSAIRKKDLDPDMVDYMIEAVQELPKKVNIRIVFNIRQHHKNKSLEDIGITALQNYFDFRIFINRRRMYRLIKTASLYLTLGFIFIFSANQLADYLQNITSSIFSEGLFIGGWVFVWESVSLLFFKTRIIHNESRRFKKIVQSDVVYKYLSDHKK